VHCVSYYACTDHLHCACTNTTYCYWYREALIELESSRFLEQIDPAHINSKHGVTVAQAAAAAAAAKGSTNNNSSSFTSGSTGSSGSSSSALDVWYRFQHPLVQQALYNLTPLSDRRKVSLANFNLGYCVIEVELHELAF
jgi:predicted ATPase